VSGVVAIGLIRRPHGLKGEVVVTDYTEGAFDPGPGQEVVLLGPHGLQPTVIESWRRKGTGSAAGEPGEDVLVKLACAGDRAAAGEYRDWRLAVSPEVLPQAPPDVYYEFELLGLPAETTEGARVGEITEVYRAGPHNVLVIEGGGRRLEVPFVRAHVAEVRPGEKVVIIPYRER
jgi:16S rRNA processing protein RimM